MRMVLAALSIVALGVAAPDDGAAKLRVAWASQYEWKESGVANATLDFTYVYSWDGENDNRGERTGKGQVVVDATGIGRRHYPGADRGRRGELDGHVAWVVGAFARKPFEEEFADRTIGLAEAGEEGRLCIPVSDKDKPERIRTYIVKNDRIVGRVWGAGGKTGPLPFTLADVGGGYAIVGETFSWPIDKGKATGTTTRRLEIGAGKDHPYPKTYRYTTQTPSYRSEYRIAFEPPVVNRDHAVVGDPVAREALETAWAARHVLPESLRFEADFRRKIDGGLRALDWTETVKGRLQVWGLDKITVVLDERIHDPRGSSYVSDGCVRDIGWMLGWMRDRPLADEFKDCGFAFAAPDDRDTILVKGYPRALGFRIEEGRLAGFLRNTAAQDEWVDFRLKKTRAGRYRIDGMTAKTGAGTFRMRVKYVRRKEHEIPTEFERLHGEGDRRGVAEYRFRRVKTK